MNPQIFLENVSSVNGVDERTPAGRLFSPGHSIEVAWFLLKMTEERPDRVGKSRLTRSGQVFEPWSTRENGANF